MNASFLMMDRMAHAASAGNKTKWRIIHGETHLSITILLPDTDPPPVYWILPTGKRIDGNIIDADVPAGETLCICDDFSRCGIDMAGCDPFAVSINTAEIPIVRPKLTNMRGRCGYFRDMRFNTPQYVTKGNTTVPFGGIRLNLNWTNMVITIADINQRKLDADTSDGDVRKTHTILRIAHAPNFTGDLAELNIISQYWYRIPNNDFTSYLDTGTADNRVYLNQRLIIHHTGVHGHCNMLWCAPGYIAFHNNPNMTPDDYDQICITLAENMQTYVDSNLLDSFIFEPDYFRFDISSRRTSASDEAVAKLRSFGMIVNEVDDD